MKKIILGFMVLCSSIFAGEITVAAAANVTYPRPQARPAAIVKNTIEISLALPGALLNLTSANAPAIENALATLLLALHGLDAKRRKAAIKRCLDTVVSASIAA
mgnify:CR=1 FL=1